MRRRRWPLMVVALAIAGTSTRAAAADPDFSGPSVCAPPCPDGEACVGTRCVRPTDGSPATAPLPRDRQPPSPPAPPPGSAPTTGPQPAEADSTPPPAPAAAPGDSHPPPVPAGPASPPASPVSPRLQHDGDPRTGSTYTPANTRTKSGFLMLPFLGVHSYVHDEATSYQPGLRFGTLVGGRLSDLVSLNGEVIFDFSNVSGVSTSFSERAYHFVFSPLIDFPAGAVQLVFGPKLGLFVLRTEQAYGDLVVSSDATGFSAGLNGGLFLPVSARTSIGVLLSFDFAGANQGCLLAPGPKVSSCGSPAAHGAEILGLTAALLF